MRVQLDPGAFMPERAHKQDAGMDLRTRERVVLRAHDSIIVDTGVHVEIPEGYAGILKSKSGLNFKAGIIGTGTVDAGYTGSIKVKLYNLGDLDHVFNAGDKLIQLVVFPIFADELEQVDHLDETERNDGGFGSTGR